ncbi:MAG: chemotaxis protein CheW [Thermodesulfobacteriota bacterium]
MLQEHNADNNWVLFRLHEQYFGVPVSQTQEMLVVPTVTPVPRAPSYVRGVINLRGKVMPLVDLRLRLNMESALAEMEALAKMLEQREEDHKNWLAELEASVREKRKFRLTTDPHACAFGKWYDGFKTDNLRLAGLLLKFDAPHQRIHAVGKEVEALAQRKEFDAAFALIDRTRETVLAKMITLFGEAREAIRKTQTEIAVVVERQGRTLALTVDSVDSVETLDAGTLADMSGSYGDVALNLVSMVGRRREDGAMVLLLALDQLFEETGDIKAGRI